MDTISLRRPDDWHVHLRDGEMLAAVLPFTARQFARAIVMPNLLPPITTVKAARAYCRRILDALRPHPSPPPHAGEGMGGGFTPLMTCYLTDATDPEEVARGWHEGVFTAVKLHPARATTNSADGVTDYGRISPVLDRMARLGMPLLIHGEVADPEVDVFDREAVFIDRVLDPLRRRFPGLRVVLEHITTEEAVDYVASAGPKLAATITAHHLVINRNAIFAGGIRPHFYCLPIAKEKGIGSPCVAPRHREANSSFSAPTVRRIRCTRRRRLSAVPASLARLAPSKPMPRCSMKWERSTGSRPSPH